MAALRLVAELTADGQPATADQQQILARWSSWGAVPGVFDPGQPRWSQHREDLRQPPRSGALNVRRSWVRCRQRVTIALRPPLTGMK